MKISKEIVASQDSENPTRRKLIKSAVAGGVAVTAVELMPTNWTKPVIQSVVLPAHAAMTMLTYTVTVTNNTMAQALTPAVVVVHGGDYAPPGAGGMASAGLKILAETGRPVEYIAESMDAGGMASHTEGPFTPGMMRTVDIMAAAGSMITVVSMYAHTNDTIAVATLNLEDGATAIGMDLDAGTEENVLVKDDTTQGPALDKNAGEDTDPQAAIAAAEHVIDGHMTVEVLIAAI